MNRSSAMDAEGKSFRLVVFDVGRALCALYIVGFHHVLDYIPHLKDLCGGPLEKSVKIGCLGFFFFCSSLLSSIRHESGSMSDAIAFWKRRAVRIVPLYLLALISFSRPFMLTLSATVGLNNFIPDIDGRNIPTLWFVSQLMVFYFLYPALRAIRSKRWLAAVCLALEVVFWIGHSRFGWDRRLWWYFPLYAAGLAFSPFAERRLFLSSVALSVGFACLTICGMTDVCPIATAFCGCGLLYLVATAMSRAAFSIPFFRFLSFSSMAAYLFHRKLYHRLTAPLASSLGGDSLSPFSLLWMFGLCVPVVFLTGWAIQKGYDRLVRRMFPSSTGKRRILPLDRRTDCHEPEPPQEKEARP